MKKLLTTIYCLLAAVALSSCAATKPVRKPIGTGLAAAGGAIVNATCAPVEKVHDSDMNGGVKVLLYIPTYPLAAVGSAAGFGFMCVGVTIYPEYLD